jgi:hypothetical protein
LGHLGRKLNAMSKAGQWGEMAAEVSDDVVALFTAIGTYAEITSAIEHRFGGLSDALSLGGVTPAPDGLPTDLLADIKSIPTPFVGYRIAW